MRVVRKITRWHFFIYYKNLSFFEVIWRLNRGSKEVKISPFLISQFWPKYLPLWPRRQIFIFYTRFSWRQIMTHGSWVSMALFKMCLRGHVWWRKTSTPSSKAIAHKENIICVDDGDDVELPDEAEFTLNVSRGKLKLPPINLYDFSQYCYSLFKARERKCCTKVFLKAFSMIHDYTNYSFDNVDSIVRRMCNCFFKAFVKKENDLLKNKNKNDENDQRHTKRRRLSAKF